MVSFDPTRPDFTPYGFTCVRRAMSETTGDRRRSDFESFSQWERDLKSPSEDAKRLVLLEMETHLLRLALGLPALPPLRAGERLLVDTSRSPKAKMYTVNRDDVHWDGGLRGDRFDVCRETMIPHMWTIFSDVHESHAWANFEMAAGVAERQRTFTAQPETIAVAQVVTLTKPAVAQQRPAWTADQLYREAAPTTARPIQLKLVPYYAWGNRGDPEMTVWLPARCESADRGSEVRDHHNPRSPDLRPLTSAL